MRESFTTISGSRLLHACEKFLADRQVQIDAAREVLITALAAKKDLPWAKAPIGRAEALRRLSYSAWESEYKQIEHRTANIASRVEVLLSLARVAGKKTVGLVADDASILEAHLMEFKE